MFEFPRSIVKMSPSHTYKRCAVDRHVPAHVCAMNVATTPAAIAVTFCVAGEAPSVHGPEVATPPESETADPLSRLPPPETTVNSTVTPLTALP